MLSRIVSNLLNWILLPKYKLLIIRRSFKTYQGWNSKDIFSLKTGLHFAVKNSVDSFNSKQKNLSAQLNLLMWYTFSMRISKYFYK